MEAVHLASISALLRSCGVTVIMCQWGFSDAISHALLALGISAVRYVAGMDLERIAMAVGARICPSVQDLEPHALGTCLQVGTSTAPCTASSVFLV